MSPHSPFTVKKSKPAPPDETGEEAAYLANLGKNQTQVTVKLNDGQKLRGWIEYYDQHMVRLTREGGANLFIYKNQIAYIAEDERGS